MTNKMRHAAVAMLLLTTAACSQRGAVERTVRENLKDPESARFGTFYHNAKLKRACLTVNAKNSMGGYTGDKEVRLFQTDDGWLWTGEEEETPEDCRAAWADNEQALSPGRE